MGLSGSSSPIAFGMRCAPTLALNVVCVCGLVCCAARVAGQQLTAGSDQLRAHDSAQWRQIEAHLPDPRTATAQALEQQADILRARRFPEDAMDFYKYAMDRGAKVPQVMNKLGLTELEMKNVELARMYFKRSVKMDPKNADAWNNLGAVEYVDRGTTNAIGDYKRAIKLDKHAAIFHANLATAYFEVRDFKGARREMTAALKLDPDVFDAKLSAGGIQAHVLTSEDRARFAYEMARMYALNQQEEQMLHSLAMACEFGMDVQREMRKDAAMAQYENDARVVVLVHNARVVRAARASTASASRSGNADPVPEPTKPLSE